MNSNKIDTGFYAEINAPVGHSPRSEGAVLKRPQTNTREVISRIDLTGIIGFTVAMTAGVSIAAVALSVLNRKPSAQVDQPANL